ncbi:MAG: PHP domain-containing protein, partial [Burkholderiaceae bacterium]
MMPYAELHCTSNFSFLRGASHPEELVARAQALGYAALAITDECSLAGVVRAHLQAREAGLALLIGSELGLHGLHPPTHAEVAASGSALPVAAADATPPTRPEQAPRLVVLACDRNGYGNLSERITAARRRAGKGHYQLAADDLADGIPGTVALFVPSAESLLDPARRQTDLRWLRWLRPRFAGRLWIAVELLTRGDDLARLELLRDWGRRLGLPLVAAGDVHYHRRS